MNRSTVSGFGVALVLGLSLVQAALGQPAPQSYSLDRPLCQQVTLGPTLLAQLTPPDWGLLGLTPPPAPGEAPTDKGQAPAAIKGIDLGELEAVALLAQLRAGDTSAEVRAGLEKIASPALLSTLSELAWWREKDRPVSDLLVKMLLARGDLDLSQPERLSEPVVLAAAEMLKRARDERCVPLYEHMLANYGRQPGWCLPLGHLGEYYAQNGQRDKAVETYLRGGEYTTNHRSHFLIDAARQEFLQDNMARAIELYRTALDTSPVTGDAWSMALAATELSELLAAQGAIAEAEAVLATPLTGDRLDAATVLLCVRRASFFYRRGDFKGALEAARAGLAAGRDAEQRLAAERSASLLLQLAEYELWATRFLERPVFTEATTRKWVPRMKGYATTIQVYTPVDAKLHWDAPGLSVRIMDDNFSQDYRLYDSYGVMVELDPPAREATLRLWSGSEEPPDENAVQQLLIQP